jgi:hypothetical protein
VAVEQAILTLLCDARSYPMRRPVLTAGATIEKIVEGICRPTNLPSKSFGALNSEASAGVVDGLT